jgi:hypoxanthine phosphoribosyltransferase
MKISQADLHDVMHSAECLYTSDQVENALGEMARAITQKLEDSNPVLICIMNGGLVPMGKLLTQLNFQLQVDYLHATRYRNTTSGNELEWKAEPKTDIKDRVVLLIDDILDEGVTLSEVVKYCERKGASEVYTAVMVEKLDVKRYGLEKADFVALKVANRYVFGYGMDYKGFLRNAPGIFAVKNA